MSNFKIVVTGYLEGLLPKHFFIYKREHVVNGYLEGLLYTFLYIRREHVVTGYLEGLLPNHFFIYKKRICSYWLP